MRVLHRLRRGRERIGEALTGAARGVGLRGGAPTAAAVAIVVGGGFGPGPRVPHVHVTPHDRAATRAYVRAEYAYLRSGFAAEAAATAASEQFAATLRAECPGVLANAPRAREFGEPFEEEQLPPRKRGERNRINTQRAEIQYELDASLARTRDSVNKAAALAFAHTIDPLHWSSAALTRYEHGKARTLIRDVTAPTPAVCADLRAWVASGYTKLSPGTKAFIRQLAPSAAALAEEIAGGPDPDLILRAYETPGERPLLRRIHRLTQKNIASLERSVHATESLGAALGIRSVREEAEEPPKGAVVIAQGPTASGGNYKIWVRTERPHRAGACTGIDLGIEEHERNRGSTEESCLSARAPTRLQADCNGSAWQVEGQTVEGATSVALQLRDGRQVSSPVALVPPTLGGPAGYYFQVLRKSEDPVSASELNAQGTVLKTLKLPHEAKCPSHVFKSPKPPESLGSHKLVSGHLPHGARFEISAFQTRFMGRIETNIQAAVLNPEPFFIGVFASSFESGPEPRARGPLKLETETGCSPRRYALLYGLLKAPEDTVLARVHGRSKAFRVVPLPPSLHLHGVLAYIALPALPSEVIVRAPDGRTVFTKSYRRRAREVRETCEGEAEP
jgi:hypothetical protein